MRHAVVIAVLAAVLLSPWGRSPHACALPAAGDSHGAHGLTSAGNRMDRPGSLGAMDHSDRTDAADRMHGTGDVHGPLGFSAAVDDTPPCHGDAEESPMPCCDGDDGPGSCTGCDCAAAGVQTATLHSATLLLMQAFELRLVPPTGTDPPEPPPGALLRPPIVLS